MSLLNNIKLLPRKFYLFVPMKLKVFTFGFMIDIMYVIWMKAVATGNPLVAGVASVLVSLPGLLGYLAIVENRKMIPPYLIGLFCGTVTGITFLS